MLLDRYTSWAEECGLAMVTVLVASYTFPSMADNNSALILALSSFNTPALSSFSVNTTLQSLN